MVQALFEKGLAVPYKIKHQPYCPAMTFLSICLKETKDTQLFIEALFIIKNQKQLKNVLQHMNG